MQEGYAPNFNSWTHASVSLEASGYELVKSDVPVPRQPQDEKIYLIYPTPGLKNSGRIAMVRGVCGPFGRRKPHCGAQPDNRDSMKLVLTTAAYSSVKSTLAYQHVFRCVTKECLARAQKLSSLIRICTLCAEETCSLFGRCVILRKFPNCKEMLPQRADVLPNLSSQLHNLDDTKNYTNRGEADNHLFGSV